MFNSLHGTTLVVNGNEKNDEWNIEIKIHDLYDFTELIKVQEYINGEKGISNLPAAIGNNIALMATNCNVVHEYDIDINFSMKI